MGNSYSKLFENVQIGDCIVKNRLAMAPMNMQTRINEVVTERHTDYYVERAKGGAGLIIVEGIQSIHCTPEIYASWPAFVKRIKDAGSSVFMQINIGIGRNMIVWLGYDYISSCPNPLYYDPSIICREVTVEEIKHWVAKTGEMAAEIKAAGFDGINVNGHWGYLCDQFMTSLWNRRTDEYGGSFENRMRYAVEILQAIREAVGPNYPVIFRMTLDHHFEGARTTDEGIEILKYLDNTGLVTGFDVDAGCYDAAEYTFCNYYVGDAPIWKDLKKAREATDKPLMAAGNFTPECARDAVEQGLLDMVYVGRGMIADPEFVNKLKEGRIEDIRPCIRCNDFCIGRSMEGKYGSCAVNAACGNESRFVIKKSEEPKHVVIVGGGPGGMEAARVCGLKGYQVDLYEKSNVLGGQAYYAATPDFKSQLRKYLTYLETQIKKMTNVTIHLNSEISAGSPELKCSDNIIVAAGGSPLIPGIPGINNENVIEVTEAHVEKRNQIGDTVVICGGGLSGSDLGLELAEEGKKVIIVDMLDRIVKKADAKIYKPLMDNFAKYDIKTYLKYKVLEFKENGVMVESLDGKTELITCDTAILAFGVRPNKTLADSIVFEYPDAKVIGDCVEIAKVGEAVRSGFFAAWNL